MASPSRWFCTQCGAPNPGTRNACYACGTQAPALSPSPPSPAAQRAAMRQAQQFALQSCPSCGHSVSPMAPACPNCGHPVAATSPKRRGGVSAWKVLCFLGVVGLVLVGLFGLMWVAHLNGLANEIRAAESAGGSLPLYGVDMKKVDDMTGLTDLRLALQRSQYFFLGICVVWIGLLFGTIGMAIFRPGSR